MAFACGNRQKEYLSPLQQFVAAKGINVQEAMENSTPIGVAWWAAKEAPEALVFLVTPEGDTLYGKFISAQNDSFALELELKAEVPLLGSMHCWIALERSHADMTTAIIQYGVDALADSTAWEEAHLSISRPEAQENAPLHFVLERSGPSPDGVVYPTTVLGTVYVLLLQRRPFVPEEGL
jgi:hypothetical protein